MGKGKGNDVYGLACGMSGRITVGEETTYGTLPSNFTRGFQIMSESLRLEHAVLQDPAVHANMRYPLTTRRNVVSRRAGGHITTEVATKSFGLLFEHMLGGNTVPQELGGSAAWLQTHTPGSLKGKSLTIQKGVPQTDGLIRPYTGVGCKIAGWDLDFDAEATLLLTLHVDARDLRSQSSCPSLVTPSYGYGGSDLFHFVQGSLTKNGVGVAPVLGGKIIADNGLDTGDFGLATLKAEPLETGVRSAGGLLRVEFSNKSVLHDAFYDDTSCTVVLTFTGDLIPNTTYHKTLKVTLQSIHFLGETPVVDNPGVVTLTAPFVVCDEDDAYPAIQIDYTTTDTTL